MSTSRKKPESEPNSCVKRNGYFVCTVGVGDFLLNIVVGIGLYKTILPNYAHRVYFAKYNTNRFSFQNP